MRVEMQIPAGCATACRSFFYGVHILNVCILCKGAVKADAKPEHILLNALGGRKITRSLVCTSCNEYFGCRADHDLAASVLNHRNLAGLKTGKRKNAPYIRRISQGGISFDLAPGGTPVLNSRPPRVSKIDDGKYEIDIPATSEQNLESSISAVIGIMRLENEAAARLRENVLENLVVQSFPAPKFQLQTQFGYGRSIQAMAKACLILWAEVSGAAEVLRSPYDAIREFIWSDDGDNTSAPFATLDLRPLPELDSTFGAFPNLIWVGRETCGAVLGYFRLFGAVGWSICLGASEARSPETACLISNPLNPSAWDFGPKVAQSIDHSWVSSADIQKFCDLAPASSKMTEFLAYCQGRSATSAIEIITDDALHRFGLEDNTIMTEEQAHEFVDYVSFRLALMLAKLPYEEPYRSN